MMFLRMSCSVWNGVLLTKKGVWLNTQLKRKRRILITLPVWLKSDYHCRIRFLSGFNFYTKLSRFEGGGFSLLSLCGGGRGSFLRASSEAASLQKIASGSSPVACPLTRPSLIGFPNKLSRPLQFSLSRP